MNQIHEAKCYYITVMVNTLEYAGGLLDRPSIFIYSSRYTPLSTGDGDLVGISEVQPPIAAPKGRYSKRKKVSAGLSQNACKMMPSYRYSINKKGGIIVPTCTFDLHRCASSSFSPC